MSTLPTAVDAAPVEDVGPVAIKAVKPFQSSVQRAGATVTIPSAFAIKNVSRQTLFLTARTMSPESRSVPQIQQTSTVTFYPGQVLVFPAPPAGRVWQVAVVSRRQVRHVVGDLGDFAFIVAGLAAYGGYELIRHRRQYWSQVRQRF